VTKPEPSKIEEEKENAQEVPSELTDHSQTSSTDLYFFSNNPKHKALTLKSPNLIVNYMWSHAEDEQLQNHNKETPSDFKKLMKILMRYKEYPIVMERYNFLGIELNEKEQKLIKEAWQELT
jgi:hypothetical protein